MLAEWSHRSAGICTDVVRTQDELRLGDTFQVIVTATDNVQIAENDARNAVVIDTPEYDFWKESPLVKTSDDTYIATFTVDDTWSKGEYCIWYVTLFDVNGNGALVTAMVQQDEERFNLGGIIVTDESLPEEEEENPEDSEEPSPRPSVSPSPSTVPSPSPSESPAPSESLAPTPSPADPDIEDEDVPEEPVVFVDVPEEVCSISSVLRENSVPTPEPA